MRLANPSVGTACGFAVLLLLAGCAGTQDTVRTEEDAPLEGVVSVEFEGDGGAVVGIVADSDQVPIARAQVILGSVAEVATDAAGRFQVRNVPPGTYTVTAHAQNYHAQSKNLAVGSGETVETRFLLERTPTADPHHEIMIREGHICMAMNYLGRNLSASFLCPGDDEGVVFLPFMVSAGLETLISELEWTPTSGLTSETLMLLIWQGGSRFDALTCDYCYGQATGGSPIYLRIEGPFEGVEDDDANDETTLEGFVRVPANPSNPGGINIVVDQRVTLYESAFYGETAPEGFSGRSDA